MLELSQFQEEKYIGEVTTISSSQMLNLNVTFSLMENLIKIQKYMSESSEDWSEEKQASRKFKQNAAIQEKATEYDDSGKKI